VVAGVGRWFFRPVIDGPRTRLTSISEIPAEGSMLFRYPTPDHPCILVRAKDGELRAYSQVCTHLACAVVHRPEKDAMFCPCHHGWFDAGTGLATGGPPTRPLPRVRLQIVDDEVFAVGTEV
jgi:Rieske Fe-S protein